MLLTRLALPLSFLLFSASTAHARDWFVRAGSDNGPGNGDGSMARPFADPWQALEACEAGDAVHVAAGKYFGRSGGGTWKIPFDNVQLIGGYDASFKERDPWKHHAQLLWDKASKNTPKEERILSNSKGTVIDGFVIDMQEQNDYVDDERTGLRDKMQPTAMRFVQPATVRNSVIINSGDNAIVATGASTIENNLIVNAVGWGVVIRSSQKEPAIVKNNTIAFTWTFKEPGKGAYQGSAVALQGPATVSDNVLAFNDNNGIYQTTPPDKVSIARNVFFMNLYANLKAGVDGRDTGIDDKSMDMLEDLGLQAHDGNEVKDPGLPLDPRWMDRYSARTAAQPGQLAMDDWNKLRQVLGLSMIARGGQQAGGVAPPWDLGKALRLMEPRSAGKMGARIRKLEVKLQGGGAVAAKSYTRMELEAWNRKPDSVQNKAIEMVAAIGDVTNVNVIPGQFNKDDYAASMLYDRAGKGERVVAFFKKGSSAQRAIDAASGWYHGSGVPDRLYLVRGTAHAIGGVFKAGLQVDSVEAYDGGGATAAARPQGRDWFVRAGSTGGDGSRDKPFKDPFQALEKAERGDAIHVAEGEYFGKLRAGAWRISKPFVSLVGGYDKDFRTRNPWKRPTFLKTGEIKGSRNGYTIEGEDDHTGAVIDGFVFDKKGDNRYKEDGDLDYDNSDKIQHVWLARPGCVIRNNVFVNGAEGALRVANGQTIENNIIVNHRQKGIDVQPGFGSDPVVIRNNTLAFAWDIKFGEGRGRSGSLLILGTRIKAVVDNNIFAFADNDAIRLQAEARDVELTRNVFSHNLYSNVFKTDQMIFVDDKSWAELSDLGFKKSEGNVVMTAGLPVDQAWFDVYLSRTAMVPGKVTMDDWNQAREILGQPLIATGGKAGGGFMPAMDWKIAIALFPKNPKVKAGARAADLPVQLDQ